jgi:hypothetical protein
MREKNFAVRLQHRIADFTATRMSVSPHNLSVMHDGHLLSFPFPGVEKVMLRKSLAGKNRRQSVRHGVSERRNRDCENEGNQKAA